MYESFTVVTDTATLCVFDLAALKHRLKDDCDWWTLPEDELTEMNQGNVAFLGLQRDGIYEIRHSHELRDGSQTIHILLNVPSGIVFVGAGEEVTGDGLEPELIRGGRFLEMSPGNYELRARFADEKTIELSFSKSSKQGKNTFRESVRLPC